MPAQDETTVEQRLARLETVLERAVAVARQYPLGRKILAMLGLQ